MTAVRSTSEQQRDQHPDGTPDAQDVKEGDTTVETGAWRIGPLGEELENTDDWQDMKEECRPRGTPQRREDINVAERLALLEDQFATAIVSRNFSDEKDDNDTNDRSLSMHRGESALITILQSARSVKDGEDLGTNNIQLPKSTFSLLITEKKFYSPACIMAVLTACLSFACLVLSLNYSFSTGFPRNPLGLPVDVKPIVRGAQFLGERSRVVRFGGGG